MSIRRISIVLVPVILAALSVLAVQTRPLLFARGTENGDLCWPGEWVTNPSDIKQNPPKDTDPPSYVETRFEKKEHTNGACEIDATCIPPDVTCSTARSDVILGSVAGTRVYEQTYKQNFVRNSLGKYDGQGEIFWDGDAYGYYTMCTDSFRDGWE